MVIRVSNNATHSICSMQKMSFVRRPTPASMQNMCMPRNIMTEAAFLKTHIHFLAPSSPSVRAGRMTLKCSSSETVQINSITSSRDHGHENGGGLDYRKGVKSLLESAPHLQKLPSEFVLQLDQNPMDAVGGSDIPTIDLSGLDGSAERKVATIKAIGDACAEWGFFRVSTMSACIFFTILPSQKYLINSIKIFEKSMYE